MTQDIKLRLVEGTITSKTINRELTGKQKCFLNRLVAGDSLIDSYEKCYRTEGMSKKTAYNRAYELRNHREIAGRLKAKEEAEERDRLSNASRRFEWVLDHLQAESDPEARVDTTAASRVAALRALGQVALPGHLGQSMFIDRVATSDEGERSSDDVLVELKEKLARALNE